MDRLPLKEINGRAVVQSDLVLHSLQNNSMIANIRARVNNVYKHNNLDPDDNRGSHIYRKKSIIADRSFYPITHNF